MEQNIQFTYIDNQYLIDIYQHLSQTSLILTDINEHSLSNYIVSVLIKIELEMYKRKIPIPT